MSSNKDVDKLEAKIDKLDERLDGIAVTLVKNTESLEYHIKRTDLLEKKITLLDEDVMPVKDHVAFMKTAFRVVSWFCMVVAGAAALAHAIKGLGIF